MSGSVRVQWNDVPGEIVRKIEGLCGSRVVDAHSQIGGFSDGSADRVLFADGSRAFVKTLSAQRNPVGFDLHRREARIMRSLPPEVPAPRLIADFEHDGWAVLVIEDVAGRHPDGADTARVLDLFDELRTIPAPSGLPTLADDLGADAETWSLLVADDVVPGGWARDNLELLDRVARTVSDAVAGDRLVHLDGRADNILLADDGRAVLIDWPWAVCGVGWMDALAYLIDQRMMDPSLDIARLMTHPVFRDADPDAIDAVLSVLAASWFDRARRPASPTMPTLRDFQRREAEASLAILRSRWR